MTKENCIRLLNHYAEMKELPENKMERKKTNIKAYDDMKEHILKSKKFTEEEKKELFKEEKTDSKKKKKGE